MVRFNKKVVLILVVLTGVTLALICIGLVLSKLQSPLLPAKNSILKWQAIATADVDIGGASTIKVNDYTSSLSYQFIIRNGAEYPYASLALLFARNKRDGSLVNLANYSKLTFTARCEPHNTLSIIFKTFDEKAADPSSAEAYPIPSQYFSCGDNKKNIEIDLNDLEIPDWWLRFTARDLSSRDYSLRNVDSIAFAISVQSPLEVTSNVRIENLVLHGRNWSILCVAIVLCLLCWAGFIAWVLRVRHAAKKELKKRAPEERQSEQQEETQHQPLEYQQLSIHPQKGRQRTSIMQLMAKEYANPELSLTLAVSMLGLNRNKINEILKEECGLTFTAYLNKLRLTEAARLLKEKEDANIAEIAYSVGYSNVSYFNKLFKGEYGCSPKTYKTSLLSLPQVPSPPPK